MDAKTDLPGFEERWLDVRATRLRYFVAGDGPPLLLVHGFAGGAANFALLAPMLARRHRVVVPDLPGHGGSTALPAARNLAGFADRVAAVAVYEGAVPATVVGHSMGGIVALRLAARWPELVSGVVLAAAAGISTASRVTDAFLAGLSLLRPARRIARHRVQVARSPLLRSLAFNGWNVSDGAALPEAAALGFLGPSRLHTGLFGAGRALAREDVRRDIELLRCPTLVLWGARDRQVPVDDAFEYARRLGAPLRVIPDCGHLLIGERADACFDAIDRFVSA
jgi:pimeloyl-ACP methyl ester carboxylesterase